MEVIDSIPVVLEAEAVARRLRHNPARAASLDLDGLLAQARSLICLRAATGISFTGARTENTIEIDGVVFRSRILRTNLEGAQKVFPFVMTAGPELERAASASGDLLKQFYLEEMAHVALENGAAWLAGRLAERWGFPSLASMDPGSLEDWPITEQPKLFALLGDTERLVGVRLTDSLLMLPRKSISGLFFPSEEGFTSCRLCGREKCPARRAPYDAAVAARYEQGGGGR